jgi:hypothetical protein
VGDEVGALERVDRYVDRGYVVPICTGPPDALADVQHRRLVAFALADDDATGELDLVHGLTHGGRGCRVGLVASPATHEPRGLDRSGLGDTHHLERKQLFHLVRTVGGA